MKNTIITLAIFLQAPIALSQSGLATTNRSATNPPQSLTPPQGLTLGENFHLRFAYTTGSVNLNLADPSNLNEKPQAGIYDDDRPVSGIFSGGGVREFRTTLAMLVPIRGQLFSFGAGLVNSQIGDPGAEMSKGPSRASLHINALALEASVMNKVSKFGYTKAGIAIDNMLDGELERRYLLRNDGTYRTITSPLESGIRMGFTGEYIVNASAGFSVGFGFGLEYGTFTFKNTEGTTSLYGINYGMSLVLRI